MWMFFINPFGRCQAAFAKHPIPSCTVWHPIPWHTTTSQTLTRIRTVCTRDTLSIILTRTRRASTFVLLAMSALEPCDALAAVVINEITTRAGVTARITRAFVRLVLTPVPVVTSNTRTVEPWVKSPRRLSAFFARGAVLAWIRLTLVDVCFTVYTSKPFHTITNITQC